MGRILLALATLALALGGAGTAAAHLMDHAPPGGPDPGPVSTAFQSGGREAQWELLASIPTGNPHTDLDFFQRAGDTYASVGTLAAGGNRGGQSIVKLTEGGKVAPRLIAGHPSATCVSNPSAALGLQHDVEASPKGGTLLGYPNPYTAPGDAQIVIDATDAEGRCHDQGALGLAGAPPGGLEIVDVTNPAQPKEIGLTSHIGEAHTVNVDPKRPHIAYAVTSDSVSLGKTGDPLFRQNEDPADADRFDLDGFEVVDLSSCMNFPAGTSIAQKRERCRPEVFRYRYGDVRWALGSEIKDAIYGCHELEIHPDDRLTCGSGAALLEFDMKGAFDDRGTPDDYTDDKPRGTRLPCRVRDSSSPGAFGTGAKVTDCVDGTPAGTEDLTVSGWKALGSPSLDGVKYLGSVHHQGRAATGAPNPPTTSLQDIDFDHEAELSQSKRLLLATDERGGGVAPPGATCTPGADIAIGNGGLHAYRAGALRTTGPGTLAESQQAYAKSSKGGKAVYRATIRTQPQGSICTAHVFQQIPGQNRIFMGWYSQGTQVVDFTEHANGTVDFREAGYFIPANANTWVSHIFKVERNRDGSFNYYGATGDFNIGAGGRNTIDVYKARLPAPPTPAGGVPPGTPNYPLAEESATACKSSLGFGRATARPRGRGLALTFTRRTRNPVKVDVVRTTTGRRVSGERRVARFDRRSRSFRWNGRGARVRNGYYVVRFATRAANGKTDFRRVALRRVKGRFRSLPPFFRGRQCTLVQTFKLERPVFGGTKRRALRIAFRLNRLARVRVTVSRKGKVVKRFNRRVNAARTYRLRMSAKGRRRGTYRVTLRAQRPRTTSTSTLFSRKL
jgi:hypothetical protein